MRGHSCPREPRPAGAEWAPPRPSAEDSAPRAWAAGVVPESPASGQTLGELEPSIRPQDFPALRLQRQLPNLPSVSQGQKPFHLNLEPPSITLRSCSPRTVGPSGADLSPSPSWGPSAPILSSGSKRTCWFQSLEPQLMRPSPAERKAAGSAWSPWARPPGQGLWLLVPTLPKPSPRAPAAPPLLAPG